MFRSISCSFLLGAFASVTPFDPLGTLARQRAEFPAYLSKVDQILDGRTDNPKVPRILVVGDSWAYVVCVGSSLGLGFFQSALERHGCHTEVTNIAVPGTTSSDWSQGDFLERLQKGAKSHDYVWVSLLGNDALDFSQECHKSPEECGEQLFARSLVNMGRLVDAVHEANPDAKVVGFGYDTMFGGLGCFILTHVMFPRCWLPGGGGNACFNRQFLRIQELYDTLPLNRSWVHNTSILGATQVAAGFAKASTGPDRHIDMDQMGPAKYWPDYEACFHPGVLGGEDSGAFVVMDEFVKTYWVNELQCPGAAQAIVV